MTNKTFSIGEALTFGWNHLMTYAPFWIVMGIIRMIASAIPGMLRSGHAPILLSFALNCALLIFQYVLTAALLVGTLMVVDGKKVSLEAIKARLNGQNVLVLAVCSFLVGLLTGVGFLLFIIPGVIIALMFAFTSYVVMDKGTNVNDTFATVRELTRGVRGKIFLLFLAEVGINILGLLCLGVGLLVTIPLTTLAGAHIYRQLTKQA